MSTEPIILKFEFEKETKNTLRYREVNEDGPTIIGLIYIQKWVLKDHPKNITITVNR